MRLLTGICWIAIFSCAACQKPSHEFLEVHNYLHISHTRQADASINLVTDAAAKVDYSIFDMLWLGGDLTFYSTADEAQLLYLDGIFDLKNNNTLLSPGNHEYANHPELLPQITGRSFYYHYYKNGLNFLVLDTERDENLIRNEQLDLFREVTDTILESSHLIILMHHLLWMMDGGELESQINDIANAPAGNCSYCYKKNNFYQDLYPALVDLQNKGVQVICIAGDIGHNVKSYQYKSAEGILFLASGLADQAPDNQVLLFSHLPQKRQLEWQFKSIYDLRMR